MDIFDFLNLIGGLALFLYGMHKMGESLTEMAGSKMQQILERLTSNKFMGVLLGMAVTAVIQSSSATTVMVVGFVNSGVMKLSQAVGIIMGANIGTTITSWILSMAGLESDMLFIKLLKPTSFAPVMAAIGVILLMTAREQSKKKHVAGIMLGFAILMMGMNTMTTAVSGLADNPAFTGLMTAFDNPFLGVLMGVILTAAIQSSSASVGILQALSMTGTISYYAAIPIVLGQNIGTCVTSLISSVGTSRNARRTAMMHLYFNITGAVIFMMGFFLLNIFMAPTLQTMANPAGIAVIHSIFNIVTTVILFPFSDKLVAWAHATIPDGSDYKTGISISKGRAN